MHKKSEHQSGNVLFIILLAVALIGLLSAAVINSGGVESTHIDKETLTLRASEVQRYASELERAVNYIIQNGHSESDIRFAHANAPSAYGDISADADKSDQVFHREGGGAEYRLPNDDITSYANWVFCGSSAMPAVGSSRADLIAVLPEVSEQFCDKINTLNSQASDPADTGSCLCATYFGDTDQYDSTPNTLDESSFEQDANTSDVRTAVQACVVCDDSKYYFYHVLLPR